MYGKSRTPVGNRLYADYKDREKSLSLARTALHRDKKEQAYKDRLKHNAKLAKQVKMNPSLKHQIMDNIQM